MAMQKKKSAIKKYAGGKLLFLELTDGALAGTETASDWIDAGYVQSLDHDDDTPEEGYADESGNTVDTDYGERVVKLSGNLMQTDKDLLDFLKETVRNKYYAVYHYEGIVGGKHQEVLYGVCTIKPKVQIQGGTKRPPIEITVLENESDMAFGNVDEAELPAGAYATAATVSSGEYYYISETAVS